MKARPLLGWFVVGAAFMATLGAPLAGAVGALFWGSIAPDGRTDEMIAASRIIDITEYEQRIGKIHYQVSFGLGPDFKGRDCISQLLNHMEELSHFDHHPEREVVDLTKAILVMRVESDRYDTELIGARALTRLSRPLLGALVQCVQHSLLASMCAVFASERYNADQGISSDLRAALSKSALRRNDAACFVLDASKRSGMATPNGAAALRQ